MTIFFFRFYLYELVPWYHFLRYPCRSVPRCDFIKVIKGGHGEVCATERKVES